jgi:hypothetical protein
MNRTASRPCRPPDVRDRPPRSIKAQRYADGDTTTIGEYRYPPLTRRSPRSGGHRAAMGKARLPRRVKGLPDNRRASKVVSHAGVEAVAGDGGNTTVHYYYAGPSRDREGAVGGRWNIVEARNGSSQATRQWVWGTQYVDEPLLMDVTLDVASAGQRPRARDARPAPPGMSLQVSSPLCPGVVGGNPPAESQPAGTCQGPCP